MPYVPFDPVTVWESGHVRRALADVEGAARFLLERWPEGYASTRKHVAARRAALATLEGRRPASAFRAALVAAAEEAGISAPPLEEPTTLLPGHIAEPWRYSKRRRRR